MYSISSSSSYLKIFYSLPPLLPAGIFGLTFLQAIVRQLLIKQAPSTEGSILK